MIGEREDWSTPSRDNPADYVYGEYCIDSSTAQAGLSVCEVPYCCGERRGGETKTAPDIARFVRLGLAYVIAIVRLRLG